jgi:hypothetical protein
MIRKLEDDDGKKGIILDSIADMDQGQQMDGKSGNGSIDQWTNIII